jgi:two-component system LytT family response regulator
MSLAKDENFSIKCVIVDDEPAAHMVLTAFINDIPWLSLVGNCYNAIQALEEIPRIMPDLIFLDVKMPELSGFQLLDLINHLEIRVIVVSAHPQYAIEGFDHNVSDYLLKPIPFDRFLKAVLKIRSTVIEWSEKVSVSKQVTTPKKQTLKDSIWIKSGIKTHSLRLKHIYYIEGLKDYVKVHCRDGVLVSYGNIASISVRLPTDLFVRIHRSYIVNVRAISNIEGNVVTMINQSKIPLAARKGRDEILRKLTGNPPDTDPDRTENKS